MKTLNDVKATDVSTLGPDADSLDLAAYNEALAIAWPRGQTAVLDDYADQLATAVLEGRAGRDAQGRDWVQVADKRRG